MADKLTTEARRANMQAVKSCNTKPEWRVRRMLHAAGYRYRLQYRFLHGRLDIAFTKRKCAVLVHGCFWHGHDCRRGRNLPTTNAEFWREKIARNKERDAVMDAALVSAGWQSTIVWECALKDEAAVLAKLKLFLGPVRDN